MGWWGDLLVFGIDAVYKVVAATVTAMAGKGKGVVGVVSTLGLGDEMVEGEKRGTDFF